MGYPRERSSWDMGFRFYDWECQECGTIAEQLTQVPSGGVPARTEQIECPLCNSVTTHERLISCPAPYTGEMVMNVAVHGGQFDTAGEESMPALPQVPQEQRTIEGLKQQFASKEYQEVRKERAAVAKRNAAKKKRLNAIKRGENINMRRDKLPGDPKLTA